MKKVSALLFLLSCFIWIYGVNNLVNLKELKETIKDNPDTILATNLRQESAEYIFLEGYRKKCLGEYNQAKSLFYRAITLSSQNDILLTEIYNEISLVYYYKSKYDTAILYAQKVIEIEETNDTIIKMPYALSNIAVYYKLMNQIDSALKYNKYALKIFRDKLDSIGVAKIENNLGNLYRDIDINSSIKHFTQALNIYSALNDMSYKAYVEHNLGLIYMDKGNYPKALNLLQSANKYKLKDNYFHSVNTSNMGFIYLNLKAYKKAEKYLKESLKINNEENGTKAHTFLNLGALYTEIGKYRLAEKHLLKAKKIAENINYISIFKSIFESLTKLYAQTNQLENFDDAFKNYSASVDSFYVNKYREKLLEYSREIHIEKTRQELQLNQKDKIIQEQNILNQKIGTKSENLLRILKIIILCLLIFMIVSFIVIARKNKALAQTKTDQEKSILETKRKLENVVLKQTKKTEKKSSVSLVNLSHELRTPLNSIIGFADLIAEINCTHNNIQEYTSIIRNNGFNLLNTVNDLIDLSKIESDNFNFHLQANSYAEIIKTIKVENSDKPHFFEKSDTVSLRWRFCEKEISIFCDFNRLILVFEKLINNAFQQTKSGFIEVGSEIHSKEIVFYIKDTGIAIESKFINQIFKDFKTLDRQDVLDKGLGIGLYISKYMLENMNSELKIESKKNEANKFWFSFQIINEA